MGELYLFNRYFRQPDLSAESFALLINDLRVERRHFEVQSTFLIDERTPSLLNFLMKFCAVNELL